jgi:hypothetical protein
MENWKNIKTKTSKWTQVLILLLLFITIVIIATLISKYLSTYLIEQYPPCHSSSGIALPSECEIGELKTIRIYEAIPLWGFAISFSIASLTIIPMIYKKMGKKAFLGVNIFYYIPPVLLTIFFLLKRIGTRITYTCLNTSFSKLFDKYIETKYPTGFTPTEVCLDTLLINTIILFGITLSSLIFILLLKMIFKKKTEDFTLIGLLLYLVVLVVTSISIYFFVLTPHLRQIVILFIL